MNAETIMRTIQLIVAPVIMVSAGAIYVGGLLSHYAAINDRIRTMARERVDLLRGTGEIDPLIAERFVELDTQLPQLLRRHGLVHHALLAAYLGILILIASMFAIALSAAVVVADWLASVVVAMFVAGVLAILVSVVLISVEVRTSHRAVRFEVLRVLALRSVRATPSVAVGDYT